mgnify:CR=1 FL=1
MISFIQIIKNINKNTLIKLILNILLLFIFLIIYYYNREEYIISTGTNRSPSFTEVIYLCLSVHTGLGIGDISPNLDTKNELGIKLIISHLICVVLMLSFY